MRTVFLAILVAASACGVSIPNLTTGQANPSSQSVWSSEHCPTSVKISTAMGYRIWGEGCESRRALPRLYWQPNGAGHVPYPRVEAQYLQVGNGRAHYECCRQMQCVESPDRLEGKRAPGSLDDVAAEVCDVPTCCRRVESAASRRSGSLAELTEGRCANEHAIAFDERDVRRQYKLGTLECLAYPRTTRLPEKPRQHRARFGIQSHDRPRSSSSSSATRPGRSAGASSGYTVVFDLREGASVTTPRRASTARASGTAPRVTGDSPGGDSSATTSPR